MLDAEPPYRREERRAVDELGAGPLLAIGPLLARVATGIVIGLLTDAIRKRVARGD